MQLAATTPRPSRATPPRPAPVPRTSPSQALPAARCPAARSETAARGRGEGDLGVSGPGRAFAPLIWGQDPPEPQHRNTYTRAYAYARCPRSSASPEIACSHPAVAAAFAGCSRAPRPYEPPAPGPRLPGSPSAGSAFPAGRVCEPLPQGGGREPRCGAQRGTGAGAKPSGSSWSPETRSLFLQRSGGRSPVSGGPLPAAWLRPGPALERWSAGQGHQEPAAVDAGQK